MPIDPKRLKLLRKGKLTRSQLAAKSKISERTIARLESETAPASSPRERTINELAKALGVEPGVLAGEIPLPDATERMRPEGGRRRQVSTQLQPEVSLGYALIKRRYGLGLPTLVNAAPLMFVLLAEGCFIWRREKAKEAREAANLLWGLGLGNSKFWIAANRAEDGAENEERSVDRRDLFAEELVEQDEWEESYNPYLHNPFADYLRALAKKIDDPEIVQIGEDIEARGPLKNFPDFTICNGDVDVFTGGHTTLNLALRMGLLRADSIPEDLLAEDALERRQEWLDERLTEAMKENPKEVREILEELENSLEDRQPLDLGPLEADSGEAGQ